MVVLMVITVAYLPLVLPLLLPGVSVNPGQIARSLVVLMLVPLAVALAVNAKLPRAAKAVKPWCDRLSSLGLVAVVVLLVVVNFHNVLSVFGTRAILAGLLFIAIGYGLGWALGGPTAATRPVLGLGTAQRNIAAALVVGGRSFTDPSVVAVVVVVAIVGLLVLLPLSRRLARAQETPTRSRFTRAVRSRLPPRTRLDARGESARPPLPDRRITVKGFWIYRDRHEAVSISGR